MFGLRPALSLPPAPRADGVRRAGFYDQLFSGGELVFEAAQGPVKYLQPHLALYRLDGSPPGESEPGHGGPAAAR